MHKKWPALTALACGSLMATLDSGILNIALPTLTRHFETSLAEAKWVVAIYSLMATLSLLPIGMLSERWGRKKLYVAGVSIFFLGSCGSLLANHLYALVASRGIQGLGASMMMTNSPIILARDFTTPERANALSLLNMMVQAGLLIGPVLASIILTSFDWHMIFVISMPLAILAFGLSLSGLPDDSLDSHLKKQKPPLDVWGTLLQILFILLLFQIFEPFLLSRGAAVLLALFCFITFVFVEMRHPKPLLSLQVFKQGYFLLGNGIGFWMFLSLAMLNTLTPSFLEHSGFSTLRSGSIFALFPTFALITVPFGSKWVQGQRPRLLTLLACLFTAGLCFFWSLCMHLFPASLYLHAFSLAGLGITYGLFMAPNNHLIITSMSEQDTGMSAAVMAVIRNLALTLGAQLSPLLYTKTNMAVCLQVAGFFALFAAIFHLLSKQTKGSTL